MLFCCCNLGLCRCIKQPARRGDDRRVDYKVDNLFHSDMHHLCQHSCNCEDPSSPFSDWGETKMGKPLKTQMTADISSTVAMGRLT